MSWRIARVGARQSGFTMVELLVTIIIAAIFFGALIPFVVYAQRQTANENMRNMAEQIARKEIEQIRQLDYASVATVANGGVLGSAPLYPTSTAVTTGTSSKTFYIGYTVTNVAATTTSAAYKVVAVAVSWAGAPQPNFTDTSGAAPKPAANDPIVLTTQVSQQYNGPQVVNLMATNATEDTTDPNDPIYTITASSSVPLVATVATQDLSVMNGSPAGSVQFTVTDLNGNAVASGTATSPTTAGGPQYQWNWDASTVYSGYYVFTATASSGTNATGNTWSIIYYVKTTGLPAPILTGTAGDTTANLSWTAVIGADHYIVLRSTTSGGEKAIYTGAAGTGTTTTYLDTGLTNGTTYYYEVQAVDSSGKKGGFSAEYAITPATGPDTTPPTAPTNLAVDTTRSTNISLTLDWTASTDPTPPSTPSGVVQYVIMRSTSSSGPWNSTTVVGTVNGTSSVPPATTYTDNNLSANTSYYYEVYAVDGANNMSADSNTATGTTLATAPTGTLRVNNTSNGNKTMSVAVYNITTKLYYTTSGSPSTTAVTTDISNKGTSYADWTSLPIGTYTVFATYTAKSEQQQQAATITKGATTTVSFSF